MKYGSKSLIFMKRIFLATPFYKAYLPCFNRYICTIMVVGVQVYMFNITHYHHQVEYFWEFRSPQYCFDSRCFARLGLGEFMTFPGSDQLTGLTQKKNLTIFLVMEVGT